MQTEISRCHADSAELVDFRAGGFVSADYRLNVTGLFFDAAVSAPQNPVSRKQRPIVAETRSHGARRAGVLHDLPGSAAVIAWLASARVTMARCSYRAWSLAPISGKFLGAN
jgi:hypothetical protein